MKKLLKILFWSMVVIGGYELLGALLVWVLSLTMTAPGFSIGEAASVGIIGGADGPTAIFVATPAWTAYILPGLCFAAGIWGLLRLRKNK